MANEIKVNGYISGVTVYAVVENAAGQMWRTDTLVFEAHSDGNWNNYAIVLSENGASGRYRGNFPTGINTAGRYNVSTKQRAGGSAVVTDPNVGSADVIWSGTAECFVVSNTSGGAQIDMTQTIPTSNTAQTTGDALNAARADGFGKWVLSGTTMTLYAGDGTTVVRTFTLDSATNPSQRT
jgi:hypothetical protein